MLGSCADKLEGIDLSMLDLGPSLAGFDGGYLVATVTPMKIDAALSSIHSQKALGLDGFNSYFFKKV